MAVTSTGGQKTKTGETRTDKTDLLSNYTKKKQETDALYETAVSNLSAGYTDAQKQLEEAKKNRQETASVNLDLLQKYLPLQNRANGLTGLGVSETATLDAYNQYAARMGNIEQSYVADSTALQQEYDAQKNALEKERQTKQETLYDNYQNALTSEQDLIYSEAMARLKEKDFSSTEEMEKYIASVAEDVSETQYKQLSEKAETYKTLGTFDKPAVKTAGVTYAVDENDYNHDLFSGTQFKVKLADGTPLWVQSRGKSYDDDVSEAAKDLPNGTVFLYEDQIYLRQNGGIYELSGTDGNNNTGHYRRLYGLLDQ